MNRSVDINYQLLDSFTTFNVSKEG